MPLRPLPHERAEHRHARDLERAAEEVLRRAEEGGAFADLNVYEQNELACAIIGNRSLWLWRSVVDDEWRACYITKNQGDET